MATVTCDRCGAESRPKVRGFEGAIAQGWGKFEALKEDGETLYHVTVCPDCLTDAEEATSKAWHSEWDLGEPDVSWGGAGANLLAIVNGRVAGILFFEGNEQDQRGWWLVMADSPDEHHHIEAPDVTEGAS